MKRGLILEGGAMRGMFTSGVIDVMLERGITFDGAIGVSAGAAFGCNYKSGQIGRAIRYNVRFCRDKRYCGMRCLLKTGNIFSTDFCYGEVPLRLDPFDFQAYDHNPMEFYVVCTDVATGKAVYHKYTGWSDHGFDWIRASASMPLVSRMVEIDGRKLLDGGIADPIPAERAIRDGADKLVVVLTRQKGYVKEPESTLALSKVWYHEYPSFLRTIARRHEVYNASVRYVEALEEAGKAVVIRPARPVLIARTEKDVRKLNALYQEGYNEAIAKMDALKKLLSC